jgi:hypothetical protein
MSSRETIDVSAAHQQPLQSFLASAAHHSTALSKSNVICHGSLFPLVLSSSPLTAPDTDTLIHLNSAVRIRNHHTTHREYMGSYDRGEGSAETLYPNTMRARAQQSQAAQTEPLELPTIAYTRSCTTCCILSRALNALQETKVGTKWVHEEATMRVSQLLCVQ